MVAIAPNQHFRIALMEHYDDQAKTEPTTFLMSFFPEEKTFDTKFVEIDIQRYNHAVAVDIPLGTSGNLNEGGQFSNKIFEPPLYDEYTAVDSFAEFERMPGEHAYNVGGAKMGRFMARLSSQLLECRRKIVRAQEVQARQILFGAKVYTRHSTLGETVINFNTNPQATGLINARPSKPWTDPAADIVKDIADLCGRIRLHGKTTPKIAIVGSDSFDLMERNAGFQARLDMQNRDAGSLTMPQLGESGANYHGVLSFRDYRLEIYTYPEFFDGPDSPDPMIEPGMSNPYIPKNQVLVLDPLARRTRAFGGVPTLQPLRPEIAQIMGVTSLPIPEAASMVAYYDVDKKGMSMIAGVRSRPLLIPTAIDTHANLITH